MVCTALRAPAWPGLPHPKKIPSCTFSRPKNGHPRNVLQICTHFSWYPCCISLCRDPSRENLSRVQLCKNSAFFFFLFISGRAVRRVRPRLRGAQREHWQRQHGASHGPRENCSSIGNGNTGPGHGFHHSDNKSRSSHLFEVRPSPSRRTFRASSRARRPAGACRP